MALQKNMKARQPPIEGKTVRDRLDNWLKLKEEGIASKKLLKRPLCTPSQYREMWDRKPALRAVYSDIYRHLLEKTRPGLVLEIGGGSGNFKGQRPPQFRLISFSQPGLMQFVTRAAASLCRWIFCQCCYGRCAASHRKPTHRLSAGGL